MKYLSLLLLFLPAACSEGFAEKNGAYHYQGKDNIVVSFASDVAVNKELLKENAALLDTLLKDTPAPLKGEKITVEGLNGDSFYNLTLLGEALFFGGAAPYQNKMLVYAFLASIYDKHLLLQKRGSPLPLADASALFAKGAPCDITRLNSYIISYAVNGIFFVSLLEMLDRPQRYFYPAKTKEELFRVLFYPELLGFWGYMASRFGAAKVLEFAKESYSPEKFKEAFAESISDVENAFVQYAKEDAKNLSFKPAELRTELDSLLNLYMTGTKKSLMKE